MILSTILGLSTGAITAIYLIAYVQIEALRWVLT